MSDAQPLTRMMLVPVPDDSGGVRHEMRPVPIEASKPKRKRTAPDPIVANPEASAQQLASLIDRLERLECEKQDIINDQRDVKAEAKAIGFDVKMMMQIVALRRLDPLDRREAEALLETYKSALGIE